MKLSHVDQAGRARMVDVGDKPMLDRSAVATGTIRMSSDAYRQVADQVIAKGDVLAVSEVAGTLAAKRTAELIRSAPPPPPPPPPPPLWASIMSRSRRVWLNRYPGVRIWARVRTVGRTGVEMEALTAGWRGVADRIRHGEGRR